MTVTIDLKPEIEPLVVERATARGLTVEAYIQRVLESLAAEPSAGSREPSRLFEEWLKTHSGIYHASALMPRIIDESRSR